MAAAAALPEALLTMAASAEKSSLDPDCRFLYVSVTFMQHIMCIASTSPGGAS